MALFTYCQFRNKEDMFKSKPYPKVNPGIFFKHLNDKPLTSDSKAVSGFFNQKIREVHIYRQQQYFMKSMKLRKLLQSQNFIPETPKVTLSSRGTSNINVEAGFLSCG